MAGALSALRNVRAHHIHPHYTTELEVTRRARAEHTEVQNEIPGPRGYKRDDTL